MPKAPAAVIGQGARVPWDDTAKQVVLPGVGMYPIGVSVQWARERLHLIAGEK